MSSVMLLQSALPAVLSRSIEWLRSQMNRTSIQEFPGGMILSESLQLFGIMDCARLGPNFCPRQPITP
jgi:hypothetical protein